jgi:hypothetical protein
MKIKVIITDWQVPFDQVVRDIRTFDTEVAAVAFINAESLKWWQANEGDRCVAEMPNTEPYQPIVELGYQSAQYELWGGEQGFHAMLTHSTYAKLNAAHYKREFTDKGQPLPGYLQVAKLSGNWPK